MATLHLLDRDPILASALREVLERHGHRIERIGLEAALVRWQETPPDLVLFDADSLGLEGYRFLVELRSDAEARLLPVLLLFEPTRFQFEHKALSLGADQVLEKPYLETALLERVNTLLKLGLLLADNRRLRRDQDRLLLELSNLRRVEQAKQEWQVASDSIHLGLAQVDLSLQVKRANRAFARLTGRTFAGILGRPLLELLPGDRRPDDELQLLRPLATGHPHTLLCEDPARSLSFEITAYPVMEGGKTTGAMISVSDVSEKKLAERAFMALHLSVIAANQEVEASYARLEDAQERLVQTEKMASIWQLAAGMAHEINNPLAFIVADLQVIDGYFRDLLDFLEQQERLLREALEAAPAALRARLTGQLEQARARAGIDPLRHDALEAVGEARGGLERIRAIVDAIRQFGAGKPWAPARVDLSEVVARVVQAVPVPAWVRVETVLAPSLELEVSEPELEEAVRRLVDNAVTAVAGGGTVTLSTGRGEAGYFLEVADTGSGVPVELRSRIFDPFFTTRPPGQGLGLGLTVALLHVKRAGGSLELLPATGRGATFRIELPRRSPG